MQIRLHRAKYLALLACLVISLCSAWSRACPADLTGNAVVDVDDLLVLINSWGDSGPADLTQNGVVDVDDLLALINTWGECPVQDVTTIIVGVAQLSDGTPVQNAVIVSDLGGEGVSSRNGTFQFDVTIPAETISLNLTAGATINNFNYVGSAIANSIVPDGITDAGVIVLSGGTPTCDELSWLPTFGPAPGVSSSVHALTFFDDGSGGGPALYAGGYFYFAGGASANHIAKWDGSSWSPLGSGTFGPFGGIYGEILALTVFDDGSGRGPALYAGGGFELAGGISANNIAKWDGSSWSPMGEGLTGQYVYALAVFDDGSGGGPALYAGGSFYSSGSEDVYGIAKWNPEGSGSWSPLGSGIGGSVNALTVFDDGSGGGPTLYACGSFTTAGGVAVNNIAKWDGKSWSPLGSGVNNDVFSLSVFDDGSGGGPALYAGGSFIAAGGQIANYIAKWNGSTWSALGSGMSADVISLTVFDDGSGRGPALYAAGWFSAAGGQNALCIAKWNGSSWSALASEVSSGVAAMTVFDDGSGGGPALYAGGFFAEAGGQDVNNIAKWNGSSWSALGSPDSMGDGVNALIVFDDGSGPALYAGGYFTTAGGISVKNIAKWDGLSWSSLGSGMDDWYVNALAVFDDGSGSGPALYAGGNFDTAGGIAAKKIAKWDGTNWSPLGNGLGSFVEALAVYDDGLGGGPALYAAGGWAGHISKWNGTTWSNLGSGTNATIETLAVFDDGGGPALYVGGNIATAGGVSVKNVAKWNGTSWSKVGLVGPSYYVYALAVFDDGSGAGPALYAGGSFDSIGMAQVKGIARWNGTSWSKVGSGINGYVYTLTVFDDGSGDGPALYAAGSMTNGIAKWDGSSWSSLGSGTINYINAMTVFDDGSGGGPALHAGGGFYASPAADSFLAKWGCSGSK